MSMRKIIGAAALIAKGLLAAGLVLLGAELYAQQPLAAPGDPVGILGPGGGEGPVADWVVLAGDETALPAIGRILEELPSDARGVAIVEVADAREEQDLPHPPGVALRWLHSAKPRSVWA